MADRIPSSLIYSLNQRALTKQQQDLYKIQEQLSSGKRLNSPKDDPIAASTLLTLKQQMTDTNQYQRSIKDALSELSLEEDQLDSVIDELHIAKGLIIQANSGATSSSDRSTIAVQLEKILDHLVSVANTNISGRYIFSGTKAYEQAVVKTVTGYVYNGDEEQNSIQIGSSLNVHTSDTAKSVFFGIPTSDVAVAGYIGSTRIVSTDGGLQNSTTLGAITANSLRLNGIDIAAAVNDGVSTTDNTASAIATATAINATTSSHGVVAEANANVFDCVGGTYTADPLVVGDLTINGVQIVGAPAAADCDSLVTLINNVGVPGVQASNNGGQLRLTAADGRNIQLQTTGNATSLDLGNFATTGGGGALDSVKRASVTLYNHKNITVEGTITGVTYDKIGINAGAYDPIMSPNVGTGVLGQPIIVAASDARARDDKYFIRFTGANNFNIYKESAPNTPLTQFKKFSAGQTFKDATTVQNVPADYAAGDTIIVEGVQFTITGAPVAGDTFTVELTPESSQNLFDSMQDAITALRNYSDNPGKLSYELGLAIINFNNSEEQVINIVAQLGSRQNLAETQEASNKDFNFFSQKTISDLEDVDFTGAISMFSQYMMAYEATQRAAVKLQELSLFRFL